MTVIIGLTGSIASGKSTISRMMTDYGIPVIDADIIARQVVEPGKAAYLKIVEYFGEGIVQEDKTINRKALGKIVFSDEEKRQKLNQIVHPQVRETMLFKRDEFVENGVKAVVLDIPLLFESNLTDLVDLIMVVYVDDKIQIDRLMERDSSTKEEALSRIKSQIPVKQKANLADVVIDNSGSIEDSKEQLKQILLSRDLLT